MPKGGKKFPCRIDVAMTKQDKDRLTSAAAQHGISMSHLIRLFSRSIQTILANGVSDAE